MLPKPLRRPGRPAERFKFDATFEQIATKVSRTPKPAARPSPERARTVRTPKKRKR